MTLLAPLFLLGALAVGLPLWLHRLSSENPNRQQFSSAMFLEPGEPRRVLAKKLQYLLLLALRIGLLVLLALTFARPALQGAAQALVDEGARLNVIVMDISASMGHGARWQRAQREAQAVIDDVPGGDLLEIVAVGRGARVLVEPTLDAAAARQAVNGIAPGYDHVDYGELMGSVDRMLRGIELPAVVHVITDLQQSSMPTRFAELAAQAPLSLELHDVSAPGDENWAVQSLNAQPGATAVAAGVRGYATRALDRRLVLELNGERAAEQALSIPAGGTVPASFDGLGLGPGANRVRVFIEPGDDLAVDDERFIVVKRPEPRSLVLVSADPRGRDALFVRAALEAVSGPLTTIESIAPAAIATHDLGSYAYVVVADAGVLGESDAETLRRYVSGGGALLLALGQRSGGLATVPVTGHAYRSTTPLGSDSGAFATAGFVDASHPALAGTEELRMAKFFRYTAIEPRPDDDVLVELDQGVPLLIDHRLGAGRVMVFASALDRDWSDLPVLPVFVPLVSGLSAHLAGDLAVQTEAPLGTTLSPRAVGLASGQIFSPDGSAALGIAAAGAGDEVLLDRIGFYEVLGGGRTELVSVNLEPSESDLTPVEPNAVERWRGLNTGAPAATRGTLEVAPAEPTPLWPWVLGLLTAVVFMESWVGNWHLRVRRGLAA
ncbi:MAG TPA: BatA and WFA domain-containing protein [Gammaproteobacteria bacterium]|nr:BatA and WFA domain-containing protein [Gammaproteobacteria bacterium]